MTIQQKQALVALDAALQLATETGLFDVIAGDVHPDTINTFCDAIAAAVQQQETETE